MKKISVVMVDGSFREKFHAVDSLMNQTLKPEEYEVFWVEYFSTKQSELLDKQEKYGNFRIIDLNRTGEYHSSYCFNQGIIEGTGEIIVIPDGDVMVDPDFLEKVWEEHQKCDELAMYIYRYDEPRELHDSKINLERLRKVCLLKNPKNYGGCLTVRKKWLLEINGYDQHPFYSSGFHANDLDVVTRFKNLGLAIKWSPSLKLYHPWHPFTLTPAASFYRQFTMIQYKFQHIVHKAFMGIDSNRNIPFPVSLMNIDYSELYKKRAAEKLCENLSPINQLIIAGDDILTDDVIEILEKKGISVIKKLKNDELKQKAQVLDSLISTMSLSENIRILVNTTDKETKEILVDAFDRKYLHLPEIVEEDEALDWNEFFIKEAANEINATSENGTNVVIFGTGKSADNLLKYLDFEKYNLLCFFDNNPNVTGLFKNDMQIFLPVYKKEVKVIVASMWSEVIYNQLLELGYERENIIPLYKQLLIK